MATLGRNGLKIELFLFFLNRRALRFQNQDKHLPCFWKRNTQRHVLKNDANVNKPLIIPMLPFMNK